MKYIHYDSIDSTNTQAKRLLEEGLPGNTVLVAARQEAGRGRLGRDFYSPPGGIYMSLVLQPACGPEEYSLITPAAAVGAARAIDEVCRLSCRIKWVNDLYLEGKKVCGILTELHLGHIIIGIGVNDAPPPSGYPPHLTDTVTSLAAPGRPGFGKPLATAIAEQVSGLVAALPESSFLEEYRRRSNVLGKRITVLQGAEQFEAVALDIDAKGRLLCQRPGTGVVTLASGEVSIRA